MDTDSKASMYEFVKNYLEGAMRPDMTTSDFARGYQQGLRSLKKLLEEVEQHYETPAK